MITVIHILIGPWGTTFISKRIDNMSAGSDCKNSLIYNVKKYSTQLLSN